jgi:hypothetical protein
MRKTIAGALVLAALAAFGAPEARAQEGDKNLNLNLLFGYRAVDTSGASEKYREDINLEKGVRLFDFQLTYFAPENLKKLFDRVDLALTNFGGDPFETFSLTARKHGRYAFRYDRKKSAYYYNDLRTIDPRTFFDLRRFDFDRVSDSASLSLTVAKPVDVYVDFDRFTKTGSSVTVLDVNRVEFEFTKPVSEKLFEAAVGINVHTPRYGLVLEQRRQDYENVNSFFLPGAADGGPGSPYPTSLSAFHLDQPYDFQTDVTQLRLNARPFDGLLFRGAARWSSQEANLAYAESAAGVDYLDYAFSTDLAGKGSFQRDIALYDFDLALLLHKKAALVGAVRYNTFAQDGVLAVGSERETSDFGFDTLGIEGGLQVQVFARLGLTLGFRHETRGLDDLETATYAEETVRDGLFGNVKWDLKNILKLTFDYQRGDTDDPFTLVAPTQFDRFRGTARVQLKRVTLSASYLKTKVRNEIEGGVNFRILYAEDDYADLWTSSNEQFNLRLGYHDARLDFGLGFAAINVRQQSDRQVAFDPFWTGPGGTFPWAIDTSGKATLFDANASWAASPSWRLGAYLNAYRNTGFWPIDRVMAKGYLEHTFGGGFIGRLGCRFVDFKEKEARTNDYKASILELSFGYRWE